MSTSEKDSSTRTVLYAACFIAEVELSSTGVVLTGTNHVSYYVDKDNPTVRERFNTWFKSCYMKAVPQSMTIIKYHIDSSADEPKLIVDDIPSWTSS